MTPLAVDTYDVSLFIHVTAVVVGFGATFAESVLFPVAMKLDVRHLPYVHRLQLTINQFFALPALIVVIVTGVYQIADRDWDVGEFWLSASFVLVLAIATLNVAYFIPADRKLAPMVEREIEAAGQGEVTLSEEYHRKARTEGMLGALTGLMLVALIFLMTVKPGL